MEQYIGKHVRNILNFSPSRFPPSLSTCPLFLLLLSFLISVTCPSCPSFLLAALLLNKVFNSGSPTVQNLTLNRHNTTCSHSLSTFSNISPKFSSQPSPYLRTRISGLDRFHSTLRLSDDVFSSNVSCNKSIPRTFSALPGCFYSLYSKHIQYMPLWRGLLAFPHFLSVFL